jgi:sulfur carrier protein
VAVAGEGEAIEISAKDKEQQALTLSINGRERTLEALDSPSTLDRVIAALELKVDRIAVEVNGEISPRTEWATREIRDGYRLEIVHFVGGGSCQG